MTTMALAEELLLLAYDDDSGKPTVSRIGLDLGMVAAVLVDLALAGRVVLAEGSTLGVADATPTGEPVADEVLARIAGDTPHTVASWVQRLRHGMRDRVLADLVARGVMREVDETVLQYIALHRYPAVDPQPEADARGRLVAGLTAPPEHRPDERTAALAALVAVVRMEPTLGLTGAELVTAHQRLQQIAASAGFDGTVSLEESTIRPSVALVIAVLARAIGTALGN